MWNFKKANFKINSHFVFEIWEVGQIGFNSSSEIRGYDFSIIIIFNRFYNLKLNYFSFKAFPVVQLTVKIMNS